MSRPAFTIRIAFGGDTSTGKSSIIGKMTDPDLNIDTLRATVGIEFSSIPLKVNENTPAEQLGIGQLIDVPGSESFKTVRAVQYRNADFVILVFALNSRSSFESLPMWYDSVKDLAPLEARYIVVGNKADLAHEREVSEAEGEGAALKMGKGTAYAELSAQSGQGINEFKDSIASQVEEILSRRSTDPKVVKIDDQTKIKPANNEPCC
jgi:small GTP-binding protein